jgi:cation:H+ antiporter
MLVNTLLLALGLTALILGGSWLVRGATALAARLGVAPILIGLTVVAFGTSTPELVVNVSAALRGSTEIGFGNVVGSNIANIGLLLALAAIIAPLSIHRTLVIREIPMMILACAATIVLAGGVLLGEESSGFSRGDGLMLLLLFAVFLYYTIGEALQQREDQADRDAGVAATSVAATSDPATPDGRPRVILPIVGGLLALVLGGEVAVRGAIGVADAMGVSEALIGLTVVAVGTSLPELATTLTAARKGQGDLAIGNIVGSNIYNLLFIWGLSVAIFPSALPAGGAVDLMVMTGFSLLLLPFVITQSRLSRLEGALMLLGYGGYIGWLLLR